MQAPNCIIKRLVKKTYLESNAILSWKKRRSCPLALAGHYPRVPRMDTCTNKEQSKTSVKSNIIQLYISQAGYNSNITRRIHEWNYNNSRSLFNKIREELQPVKAWRCKSPPTGSAVRHVLQSHFFLSKFRQHNFSLSSYYQSNIISAYFSSKLQHSDSSIPKLAGSMQDDSDL